MNKEVCTYYFKSNNIIKVFNNINEYIELKMKHETNDMCIEEKKMYLFNKIRLFALLSNVDIDAREIDDESIILLINSTGFDKILKLNSKV